LQIKSRGFDFNLCFFTASPHSDFNLLLLQTGLAAGLLDNKNKDAVNRIYTIFEQCLTSKLHYQRLNMSTLVDDWLSEVRSGLLHGLRTIERVARHFVPFHFLPGHFVPVISSPYTFRTRSFHPRSFCPLVISSPRAEST
jgi:hypothetical protein